MNLKTRQDKTRQDNANGFTRTQNTAIQWSTLFWGLLGLWVLYKCLLIYFEQSTALLTTSLILIGSNLFWFIFAQPGMAHPILFTLYTLLIWITIKLHEQVSIGKFILLGLCIGFIILIRPTEIVCLFIPLLFNMHEKELRKEKWVLIKENFVGIACFAGVAFLVLLPQLLIWKYYGGSYLYYSYGDQGFDWRNPEVWKGLFGVSNGWFIYTPLAIIALIGMIFKGRLKSWWMIIILILGSSIYINYSWWCYYYINGFGSRPMIHILPLLSFPLAHLIAEPKKKVWTVLLSSCLLFCVFVNISQSMKKIYGLNNTESDNSTFFWSTLFKTSLSYDDLIVFDAEELQPNPSKIKLHKILLAGNFDSSESGDHLIPEGVEYSPQFFEGKANEIWGSKYVKVRGDFSVNGYEAVPYNQSKIVLSILRGDSTLLWKGVRISNKIGLLDSCEHLNSITLNHNHINEWGRVEFFIKLPATLQAGDVMNLGIWNIPKKEVVLDNISLELWSPN